MKRTKRYGGFRIGDRVKHEHFGTGVVTGYYCGCIFVDFDIRTDVDCPFAPNQLINLTSIEENIGKILEPAPLISEEINRLMGSICKILEYSPLPSPYTRDVYSTTNDFITL